MKITINGKITDSIAIVIAAAMDYGRGLTATETTDGWDIVIDDQTATPFDSVPADSGENEPPSPFC